ncbi:MAG: hypothetical protein AAF408_08810 [Pseudomonadota bacterium]
MYQTISNIRFSGRAVSVLLICAAIGLSGCNRNNKENRILFDGQNFRVKVKTVDKKKSLADFTVSVRDVSRSLDGAREAGRYNGIRYCIEKFGSSQINWAVGPDTDPAQLRIEDNELVFRGTCQRP